MHPFAELTVPAGSVGIHWFEQNAYALKDPRGTTIQIDPYYTHVRPAQRFIRPQPPLDESELPTDYVLVTHAHRDHTSSETIARIHQAWPEARYIGPQDSIEKILQQTDVDKGHTVLISAGESVALGDVTIHASYSKPPVGDPEANIPPPSTVHLGYVIEMESIKVYVSGDAINTFANHGELIDPVAALEPDIGFLTTHPTEGEFPTFEGSVLMAQKLGLKTAVPSHYACFVARTYDPHEWAALFPADGPRPLIIPWNSHIIYP